MAGKHKRQSGREQNKVGGYSDLVPGWGGGGVGWQTGEQVGVEGRGREMWWGYDGAGESDGM